MPQDLNSVHWSFSNFAYQKIEDSNASKLCGNGQLLLPCQFSCKFFFFFPFLYSTKLSNEPCVLCTPPMDFKQRRPNRETLYFVTDSPNRWQSHDVQAYLAPRLLSSCTWHVIWLSYLPIFCSFFFTNDKVTYVPPTLNLYAFVYYFLRFTAHWISAYFFSLDHTFYYRLLTLDV
jgi:hypothetical protein